MKSRRHVHHCVLFVAVYREEDQASSTPEMQIQQMHIDNHVFIFLVIGCKSVGPCSGQATGSQTRFKATSGELFETVLIKAAVKFAACLLDSCFGAADNSYIRSTSMPRTLSW